MGGRKKSQTVGYRYRIGMHMVLCHGPVDAVQEIKVGDRTVYGDASRTPMPWNHGMGRIGINQPNLFGGDEREGGVVGQIDVLNGEPSQGKNDYLVSRIGSAIPAFRGVLSIVARQLQVSANNPYIKPWAVRVRRFTNRYAPWQHTDGEVATDSTISQNFETVGMNPAHIVGECLCNPEWGMGYPIESLDGASFGNAEVRLRYEFFGLNMLWTRQQPIDSFIQQVLDHIGGLLYVHPQTGLFTLRLVRDEYAWAEPPLLGPDEIVAIENFERAQWGDLPNEITVVYSDWETGGERTVTAENLVSIQLQGGVINQRRDYPGVNYPPLAAQLALRDLKALGSPLARMRLKVARAALQSQPLPGDVFAIYWPRLNIERLAVRVVSADYGTLADPGITLEVVEDVFGMGSAVVADEAPTWQPSAVTPQPPTLAVGYEVPYWELARNLSRADLAYVADTDTWLAALAANGAAGQVNWALYTGVDQASAQARVVEDYAPLLTLTPALPQSEADAVAIPFTQAVQLARLAVGDYAWLVSATGSIREAVEILAIDLSAATVSLARGVLDTTPQAHAAGTRVIGAGDWIAPENIDRAPGEIVWMAVEPRTATLFGSLAQVVGNPLTLRGRQARPYPPGRVRLNAQANPVVVAGDLAIGWAHRDRIAQTAYLVHQDEGDMGPESGTTYTVRIRNRNTALVRTETGLTGTTWTWDVASAAADAGALGDTVTLEIESLRNGWTSWQAQQRTTIRAGYGLRYGQYYGGI